jgi:hypothetical protein
MRSFLRKRAETTFDEIVQATQLGDDLVIRMLKNVALNFFK